MVPYDLIYLLKLRRGWDEMRAWELLGDDRGDGSRSQGWSTAEFAGKIARKMRRDLILIWSRTAGARRRLTPTPWVGRPSGLLFPLTIGLLFDFLRCSSLFRVLSFVLARCLTARSRVWKMAGLEHCWRWRRRLWRRGDIAEAWWRGELGFLEAGSWWRREDSRFFFFWRKIFEEDERN